MRRIVLSMGLEELVVGCGNWSRTSGEANHGIALAGSAPIRSPQPQNPVHTIALPHDEPLLPPGPGREEFVTACVVCHSPRYITLQPRFTRSAWLGGERATIDGCLGNRRANRLARPHCSFLRTYNSGW